MGIRDQTIKNKFQIFFGKIFFQMNTVQDQLSVVFGIMEIRFMKKSISMYFKYKL